MPLPPGARLGPYQVTAPLGAGGMGEVYQARDTRLGRDVALKILPQHLTGDPDRRQRFLREARAASLLNHPNIITIHDIAEEAGEYFIVMELVAGSTLAGRKLETAEAVAVARQIVSALVKAHSSGIVHRDLKPANIMLNGEGMVKVLDFGLAKLEEPRGESESTVFGTQAGVILGTAAYMSPEQAEGRPVDARSDIFSFGLVLYEMLSGRRAFVGDSPITVMASILHNEPATLEAPKELVRIVGRCLRKDPADRFQSAADLLHALEDAAQAKAPDPTPSIAVLPFANLSSDKENEYFSDGLAEEIINAITRLPGLKVTPRTSAFAFRGKSEDLRTIGETLGVGHLLEGSVRRAGNRVRVMAQLFSLGENRHLWSERYDREMTDVFEIQDEISQAIVEALKLNLAQRDEPIVHRGTENLEAYHAYLEGRYLFYHLTAQTLERCRLCFERAIALDAGYSEPHAALSEYFFYLALTLGRRPHEVMPRALAEAESALRLDAHNADAYLNRALIRVSYQYDWKGAGEDFRRALEINPSSALAHYRYAFWWLCPQARHAEAAAEVERALALDPMSVLVRVGAAFVLVMTGRAEKALALARAALDLFPTFWIAWWVCGYVFYHQNALDEAEAMIVRGLEMLPSNVYLLGILGALRARRGQRGEATKILAQLEQWSATRYVPPVGFLVIFGALGDSDSTFHWLHKAVDERDQYLIPVIYQAFIAFDFRERFFADPRWPAFLRSVNMA